MDLLSFFGGSDESGDYYSNEYFIHGKKLTEDEFNSYKAKNK